MVNTYAMVVGGNTMTRWLKTKDGLTIDVDDEHMREASTANLRYFIERETGKPMTYWMAHRKELAKILNDNEVVRHYWDIAMKYNVYHCDKECSKCKWGEVREEDSSHFLHEKTCIEYWGCKLKDVGIRVITEMEEELEDDDD